jgi:hypothetical protein
MFTVKGSHHTEETKNKIRASMMGKNTGPRTEEVKAKLREANIGKKASDETKKKMSIASTGRTYVMPDATKKKLSLALRGVGKGKIVSKETRRKLSENNVGMKGMRHSEKSRARMSASGLKRWEGVTTLERKKYGEAASVRTLALWKDVKFVKKQMVACNISPNRPETALLKILNFLFPGEWKFTGDLSFTINGKCPDFVNCNGQKKIIELFGDYWHRGEDPRDRELVFAPFGYKTLVVWEKELRDEAKLMSKLQEFYKNDDERKIRV